MWRYALARTTGVSHIRRNEECQDRAQCCHVDGTLLVAVADGAGSAPLSGPGAEAAVAAAIDHLSKVDDVGKGGHWIDAIEGAARAAKTAIEILANQEERPVRDFACTLLLLVADPRGGAALQIGDGVIAVRRRDDDAWAWIIWPQKGEYANTTRFLVDPDAELVWECAELGPDVVDLAIMTDGLESLALKFSERAAHDNFFEGLLGPLRQSNAIGEDEGLSKGLGDFLLSPRVTSRADDDLTLVLATRRETSA